MSNSLQPSRCWFQFGLGTMLLAVTAIAAVLAYQVNWMRERRQFLAIGGVHDMSAAYAVGAVKRPGSAGLLPLFGELGVSILAVMDYLEIDTARAQQLFPEAEVHRPCFINGVMAYRRDPERISTYVD
jgi:hypothetical protein